jgi:hypothetical protein
VHNWKYYICELSMVELPTSSVKVAVRIRPLSVEESYSDSAACIYPTQGAPQVCFGDYLLATNLVTKFHKFRRILVHVSSGGCWCRFFHVRLQLRPRNFSGPVIRHVCNRSFERSVPRCLFIPLSTVFYYKV